MPRAISSLTAVMVARDECPSGDLVDRLSNVLSEMVIDLNIVIVANGTTNEVSLALKNLVATVPDLTVVFLGVQQHDDIARLVGIDQAIGDYVLFCTPTQAEVDSLPRLLDPLSEDYDLVVGIGEGGVKVDESLLTRLSFRAFRALFLRLTGFPFEARPPGFRVFSRAAALYVATNAVGEVLIRSLSLGPGFPAQIVALPAAPTIRKQGTQTSERLSKALRLLLTSSSLPLRLSSIIGLAGGFLSLLYAVYVACIYFFKKDVQAGWTTLSLQTSGMMFIFSVLFVFLAEYLIQILSTSPARGRRHLVTREITSQISRRSGRLNVVDGSGDFQLGAPADLVAGARTRQPA